MTPTTQTLYLWIVSITRAKIDNTESFMIISFPFFFSFETILQMQQRSYNIVSEEQRKTTQKFC